MLRFDVERLLEEKGRTKYWLWKRTNLTYTNFDNLIKNRTKSIRYDILEKICGALECTPNDLFITVEENSDKKSNRKNKKG